VTALSHVAKHESQIRVEGANTGTPVLRVNQLHKHFGPLHVLRGVSLQAREGDVIALIGSSGSGKSTLLRCINFLEIPDTGEIEFAGERLGVKRRADGSSDVADHRQIDRLRTRVGMVFQSFNLWSHLSIIQNVIEAPVHVLRRPRGECIKEAQAILDKVGIGEKRDHYPSQLSGGQQQRAAIARALAMRPQIILFDEPTSALDPELVGEVLRVIRRLAEDGTTMLIATHEMSFAREVATHAMFLHNGVVEEEGPANKVFDSPTSERCRQFVNSSLSRR